MVLAPGNRRDNVQHSSDSRGQQEGGLEAGKKNRLQGVCISHLETHMERIQTNSAAADREPRTIPAMFFALDSEALSAVSAVLGASSVLGRGRNPVDTTACAAPAYRLKMVNLSTIATVGRPSCWLRLRRGAAMSRYNWATLYVEGGIGMSCSCMSTTTVSVLPSSVPGIVGVLLVETVPLDACRSFRTQFPLPRLLRSLLPLLLLPRLPPLPALLTSGPVENCRSFLPLLLLLSLPLLPLLLLPPFAFPAVLPLLSLLPPQDPEVMLTRGRVVGARDGLRATPLNEFVRPRISEDAATAAGSTNLMSPKLVLASLRHGGKDG